MKKLIALPLIAATALGLSACTKHETNENVTVNTTSTDLNTSDLSAPAADNAAGETLDNGSNAADALTNG